MLKLVIGSKDGRVQNASVPVRWCVDKETLDKLKQEGVINPHILIVTVAPLPRYYGEENYFVETTRQLISLEQVEEYIQFQKPGKNIVYATIVWSKSGKYSDLWEKYIKREGSRYETDVIIKSGGKFSPPKENSVEFAEVEIILPNEVFAKEYPEWLKRWVNRWFRGKPQDQCHFRRRMIVAFTIQPLMLLIKAVSKFVISLMAAVVCVAILGCKKVDLSPLAHPLDGVLDDILDDAEPIFMRKWKDKQGNEHLKWNLLPLTPIYPLFIFFLHYIKNPAINYFYGGRHAFGDVGSSLFITIIVVCGSVMLMSVLDVLVLFLISLTEKANFVSRKEAIKKYEDEYWELLCDGDLSTEIKRLPPKRRTIHLRFQDLKAKVCKPLPQ